MIVPRIILLMVCLAACGGSHRAVEPAEPTKPLTTPPVTTTPTTTPATEATAAGAPSASAPDRSGSDPVAAEQAAYAAARPVIMGRCAVCHSYGSNRNAPAAYVANFNVYPVTGKYSKVIGLKVREVLGGSGKAAIMPKDKPGSLSSEELALMLAWADAWSRAHPDAALN